MKYLLLAVSVFLMFSCGKGTEGLTTEEYIEQHNLQATALENGVYIVVHEEGNENRPTAEHVVDVNFEGKLADGTSFGSASDFKALLGNLIQGWQIGLPEIGEGGSCTLIIPYKMGYGETAQGPIPARSTLVYDVELNKIFETLTVDEYIAENNLTTVELDKGVHIAVHAQGSEERPSASSNVRVNYVGKLTNELIFDQGENVSFGLSNLIEGWRIGLQELGEGGSCTLVIPAEAGYGSAGSGSIPPNAPIVFEIDLLEVD